MDKKLESVYTTKLANALSKINCLVIPFTANVRSLKGIPDRRIVHSNFRFFAEIKVLPNKLSEAQRQFQLELWKRKDYAFTLYLSETEIRAAIITTESEFRYKTTSTYEPQSLLQFFPLIIGWYEKKWMSSIVASLAGH